jgi:thioredoxin 1
MIVKTILGILVGVGIGAVVGHFGKCSSGGCPLTANPFRGAIYGGIMGALFMLSSPKPATIPSGEQPAPGEGVIHISTPEEFNRYVVQATMPCLADFYSDGCPPCRRLAPTIEKLAEKYRDRAVVCKINTDVAPQLARQFGIRSIPAVLFFANGQETQRIIGLKSQSAYENILNQALE